MLAREALLEVEWRGRDPFRLRHQRTVLVPLRLPIAHQRDVVATRLRRLLRHQRAVHERIEAIVHSRRVLPSQVLAGFSPDALRVTARAEKE